MANSNEKEEINFVFNKVNYKLMIIGLILIILGLIFLSGGGSKDPEVFNEAVFNLRRMVIAPVLMLAGFVLEIYAIMYRSKEN